MDTLSFKTPSANDATVVKTWVVIDAEGQILGRLASQIAYILRGKHKPYFTPHVDCGDNVIIINSDKVRLSGKKWEDKVYVRHTGFMGGQRFTSPTEMMARDPRRMVEKAVRGMLPKNKLGRELFRNMRVYAGTEHPHANLNPQPINLRYN